MDGCAQKVIHHLVSRGLNHLGCSHISILASVFFFVSVTGIKSNAFGRSHGWLRNWGHTYICPASKTMPLGVVMDGCATWAAMRHVYRNSCQCVSRDLGSIRRSAKTAAQPSFQHSVHVFKSSLYAGGGLFQPSSQDFSHGAVMWGLQGRRGRSGRVWNLYLTRIRLEPPLGLEKCFWARQGGRGRDTGRSQRFNGASM